jgi:hypothetical protein
VAVDLHAAIHTTQTAHRAVATALTGLNDNSHFGLCATYASSGSGPSESEGALAKRAARRWKACLGKVFHR